VNGVRCPDLKAAMAGDTVPCVPISLNCNKIALLEAAVRLEEKDTVPPVIVPTLNIPVAVPPGLIV
jgi:hypothetical protein